MIYFKAFRFNGMKSARHALDNMEISDTTFIPIKEEEVAEISVNNLGVYSVHGSWNQNYTILSAGIDYYTPLSNVFGLIFSPGGAFAGVGSDDSISSLIGHINNIEIRDPVLNDFAASMGSDTSALVVLGDQSIIDATTEELIEYETETFEVKLEDEIQATIQKRI